MKILQVLHQFLPDHTGGIELYVRNLSKHLIHIGNEVLLFCGEGDVLWNPMQKKEIFDNLRVIVIHNKIGIKKNRFAFFRTFKNPAVIKLFDRVLRDFEPDIVHFHHTMYLSGDMIFFTKKRGIPVILTIHDFWPLCHKLHMSDWQENQCQGPLMGVRCSFCFVAKHQHFLRRNFKRLLCLVPLIYRTRYMLKTLHSADILVSPAMFIQKILSQHIECDRKVKYIPYGIPVFHSSFHTRNLSDEIIFGYLGAIKRHKGLHILIKAFNRLVHEKVILNIYGDISADLSYYYELIQNCQNSRVFFKGPYNNEKVSEILNETDVMIVPSVWRETGPMVILEALANKKPVIASNLGGMAELVHDGENGFLFEYGNSESLLKCICSIIEQPSMLNKTICFDKKYSIENNASEIFDIYRKLTYRFPDN